MLQEKLKKEQLKKISIKINADFESVVNFHLKEKEKNELQ